MAHQIYEVFLQTDRGEPFAQVGSLAAPDREFAMCLAKELFSRRGEGVALWVVPRGEILSTPLDEGSLVAASDRTYRLGEGYRITVEKRRRLKGARAS